MKWFLIFPLFLSTCGLALPLGDPSTPSLFCEGVLWENPSNPSCNPCANWCRGLSFRLGFWGDYVFDRHLERKEGGSLLEKSEIYTNAVLVVANYCNRLDLFATFGSTSICLADNQDLGFAHFETRTDSSWSVGGQLLLWQCDCTSLGLEGQYFSTTPKLSRVKFRNGNSLLNIDDVTLDYWEAQVGLAVSQRIHMLVPFVGVKWAAARLDPSQELFVDLLGNTTLPKLENERCWGYVIGVSLIGCERAAVTVEARFYDETAFHIVGQIRF